MTALLQWRFAERSDRPLLQAFVCTRPAKALWVRPQKRHHHPKPWELEVQSYFRALSPPLEPDSLLMLGMDSGVIGAALLLSRLETDWSRAILRGIAVAAYLRGRGGAHAREALEVALAQMQGLAHEAGAQEQFVLARIDVENDPSRRLFESAGFVHLGDATDRLQEWGLITPL